MELLITLTLIYAVVLAVALVASLLAIWLSFRRIATILGQVEAALAGVANETRPLEGCLRRMRGERPNSREVSG